MLIDGQIRNRLVSLADTLEEGSVDHALHAVVQGAATRRKRAIATRASVAAVALTVAVAGLTFGWDWSTSRVTQPAPADQTTPVEQDEAPRLKRERRSSRGGEQRVEQGPSEGRSHRGSKSGRTDKHGNLMPGAAGAGSTKDGSQTEASSPAGSETDKTAGQQQVLRYVETHREVNTYQPSYVSANPDRRSGCSLDGNGCLSFFNEPEDSFAKISVSDEAGAVFVRITQWDRHGRRIGEPLTYCGGESPMFSLMPDVGHVSVSVESGTCDGAQKTPSGGEVEVTFFKQI